MSEDVTTAIVWFQWNGEGWKYDTAFAGTWDPPPASAWSDVGGEPLLLPYVQPTECRITVDNGTGGPLSVRFQETLVCAKHEDVRFVVSEDGVGSWDDWHITINDDPVFHIKKGTDTGVHHTSLHLKYSASKWTYRWNDTGSYKSPAPSGIPDVIDPDRPIDIAITITNEDDKQHTVIVQETRTLGTRSTYDGSTDDKDIAWQLGGEEHINSTWTVTAQPQDPDPEKRVMTFELKAAD